MVVLSYWIALFCIDYLCSMNIIVERHSGIDVIFDKEHKIKSIDVYVDKNIYFLVISEGGRSSLKALNYSQNGPNKLIDVLQFPVQSAQTVALDWVNDNLYWADRINRFFEVVDISHGLVFPLPRQRRRILFSQEMADIDSMVVDPWEQYIFWLQIGADMVLERARLNGQDRVVIYRSIQYKSSCLTIDRHTKMLFWLGIDATIHRVDYQGRTGCSMHLDGDWKNWKPSFFVFSESRLLFISNGVMWTTVFSCGSGVASNIDAIKLPSAIVAVGYQIARPGKFSSQCLKSTCQSICLPSIESQYQCSCSTGINYHSTNTACRDTPMKSLIIASPPRIYQLSLDTDKMHMDPIFEDAGIPFRMVFDVETFSLFYVDYNSSSIHVLPLSGYRSSFALKFDSPVLFQAPTIFAIDSLARNIYWMNDQTTELWVARVSKSFKLKNTVMLLSWKSDTSLLVNRLNMPPALLRGRQAPLPGDLAVDSNNRFLFVSAIRDRLASIERYWLDGSNRFVVLQSSVVMSPRGLALNSVRREIYFVDTIRDEMISVGYNGNNYRVIAKRFPDFFGLTYLDGYIYWTDLETLTVNRIRTDGTYRSLVVSTHNLRAATMPIVSVSMEYNATGISPCGATTTVCDQLCFPTRSNSHSYSCGCSNSAHVLLNMSRCSRTGRLVLMYNSTYILLRRMVHSADKTAKAVFEYISESYVSSVQMDRFRNVIYWVDNTNNCVEKTIINTHTNKQTKIFCLTTDKIMSISLDASRNNLYVSIQSAIWSRIEVIRLPFANDELMWRRVVVSITKEAAFVGSVSVHSVIKRLFWITAESDKKSGIVRVYQSDLSGGKQEVLWQMLADVDQLLLDDDGMNLYWKNSQSRTVFVHNIMRKTTTTLQLSDAIPTRSFTHIHISGNTLYLSLNSSLFRINTSAMQSTIITRSHIELFRNVSVLQSVDGFTILSQNESSKIAVTKSDINLGTVVMCPEETSDTFAVCTQFCLPSSASARCSCGSPYSLKQDGYTCAELNNHLLMLTSSGEVIGLEMTSRHDRHTELDATEWIEIPEHQLINGQRFIDAIYWTTKNIVLLLDNEGRLIGKHRSWPYHKSKIYKQLSITKDDKEPIRTSSTYEKAYKHFLEKDLTYRDQYESSRFSIALDPISNTLIWSDWVNGVIVTERLNNNRDTIDYLGIVVDFRDSSRRPLKIAVAPISSSLVWISADLAITGSSDNSIWREFWIELSDMDGSRRTVLAKDIGVPSCLTVDIHTGRVYWIDKSNSFLMYIHVHWDNYQIKAGHVLGRRLKVTMNSILSTGIGHSSSAMTVLKRHLMWADWSQQILASASLDVSDQNMPNSRMATEKIQVFELTYVKQKLTNVVKLLSRLGVDDFRLSSVGSLLQNHPCSHEMSDINGHLCSHLCLSTIPISLAEEYSFLMTAKQLGGKYRCACPYDMTIQYSQKPGSCLKSTYIRCHKNDIICRAGRIFVGSERLISENCLAHTKQCDTIEDCLDGSDEVGCSHCNVTHPYSCSRSDMCMDTKKRCDGRADCDSDELCCDQQKFECLTGNGPSRCISVTERCNGVRNCIDGSDESGCHLRTGDKTSLGGEDFTIFKSIRDNHLVAIITGCVALLACSVAIVYICVSRRHRNKTVHESCMFRANNVNIMLMSNSERVPRHSRRPRSQSSMFHAQSCDIIDVYKSHHDSEQLTHSLTSLSDIYQRIRDPHPDKYAALKIPLFTIQDDVLFNFNRFRRAHDPYVSNDSIEKFENPPPSEVTANSEDSVNFVTGATLNHDDVTRSSDIITPCESELEEIYFHRYRSYVNRAPNFHNYPSRLLHMLLTSNHSDYLQPDNIHSTSRRSRAITSHTNHSHQRHKKSFRHQKRSKSWKTNLSLSPRRKLYCSQASLATENISPPPPPSPITVVST